MAEDSPAVQGISIKIDSLNILAVEIPDEEGIPISIAGTKKTS